MIRNLKIAFIADDINNFTEFDIFHNATFSLMLAAQKLQAKVFLTKSNNLKIVNNKVFAKFDEVVLKHELKNYLTIQNSTECLLDSFNIIFARKDPPINENFISYVQTLLLVSNAFIINNPKGILSANEKLYALNFPQIIPPTIVTSDISEIKNFLNSYKEAVIKPLFNRGGEGVFYLSLNDNTCESIIESSTQNGNKTALVQKYLPEVINGDKRIVLLNGVPLGAIYRIPKAGEFRANIRRGASVKACKLSNRDLEICEALKPLLQKDKIYFASIDVIGDYLIEVNVTCPASLQEVERCTGRPAAEEIVKWAINKV
ncbi:MAG: glutathione synthase [Candidatus Melainabacteria bacterium]|nr:glutathione synthase [Candidatus Melainabacteria bacterium]